jgi:excisionase family DNA binding protein
MFPHRRWQPLAEAAGDRNLSDTLPRPLGASIRDTAHALGVSDDTVHRLVSKGALKALKIGSKTIITTESRDAYWLSLPAATFRVQRGKAA